MCDLHDFHTPENGPYSYLDISFAGNPKKIPGLRKFPQAEDLEITQTGTKPGNATNQSATPIYETTSSMLWL